MAETKETRSARKALLSDSERDFASWWHWRAKNGASPREAAEEAWSAIQRTFTVEYKRKRRYPQ